MKTKIVKTPYALSQLPAEFKEYTIVEIRSKPSRVMAIKREPKNCHFVAMDHSCVMVENNCRLEACDFSQITAVGDSLILARGDSRVGAWDRAKVMAYGRSTVAAAMHSHIVVFSPDVQVRREGAGDAKIEVSKFHCGNGCK